MPQRVYLSQAFLCSMEQPTGTHSRAPLSYTASLLLTSSDDPNTLCFPSFTQAAAIAPALHRGPDPIPTAACDVSAFLLLLLHRKGAQSGETCSSGTQDWSPKEPLGAVPGTSGAMPRGIYPGLAGWCLPPAFLSSFVSSWVSRVEASQAELPPSVHS